MGIELGQKKVTLFFASLAAGLTLAHLAVKAYTLYGPRRFLFIVTMFDLDAEWNIPSFYSAATMLFCSALLLLIGYVRKQEKAKDYLYWLGLSAIFLFLATDEAVQFHDRLSAVIQAAKAMPALMYDAWIIPYGLFVVVVGLLYLKFLMRLPLKTRLLFIVAGTVYIAGAIGLEMVGERYHQVHHHLEEASRSRIYLPYLITYTLEEVLEMAGIVIFISGLLSYIETELHGLNIRIASGS